MFDLFFLFICGSFMEQSTWDLLMINMNFVLDFPELFGIPFWILGQISLFLSTPHTRSSVISKTFFILLTEDTKLFWNLNSQISFLCGNLSFVMYLLFQLVSFYGIKFTSEEAPFFKHSLWGYIWRITFILLVQDGLRHMKSSLSSCLNIPISFSLTVTNFKICWASPSQHSCAFFHEIRSHCFVHCIFYSWAMKGGFTFSFHRNKSVPYILGVYAVVLF